MDALPPLVSLPTPRAADPAPSVDRASSAIARALLFEGDRVEPAAPLPTRGYVDPRVLRSRGPTAEEAENLRRGLRADGLPHLAASNNAIGTASRGLSAWERGIVGVLDARAGVDPARKAALARLLESGSFQRLSPRARSESLALFGASLEVGARLANVSAYTEIVESAPFRRLPPALAGQAQAFLLLTLDRPAELARLPALLASPEFARLGDGDRSELLAFLSDNADAPERLARVVDLAAVKADENFRRLPPELRGFGEALLFAALGDPARLAEVKRSLTSPELAGLDRGGQAARLEALRRGDPRLAE